MCRFKLFLLPIILCSQAAVQQSDVVYRTMGSEMALQSLALGNISEIRASCSYGEGGVQQPAQQVYVDENEVLLGAYCREVVEIHIRDEIDPNSIPDMWRMSPASKAEILDFWGHVNSLFGGENEIDFQPLVNLASALSPYIDFQSEQRQAYGVKYPLPSGGEFTFDLAEAVDLGASLETLIISGTVIDSTTLPPVEPRLEELNSATIRWGVERCYVSAVRVFSTGRLPENSVNMPTCYSLGRLLARDIFENR